jgi:hypothetical protein
MIPHVRPKPLPSTSLPIHYCRYVFTVDYTKRSEALRSPPNKTQTTKTYPLKPTLLTVVHTENTCCVRHYTSPLSAVLQHNSAFSFALVSCRHIQCSTYYIPHSRQSYVLKHTDIINFGTCKRKLKVL